MPLRWALRMVLKGDLLDASLDGHIDATEDLQLSGYGELTTSSLRRGARWFGLPIPNAEGLNAMSLKGQLTWARRAISITNAKLSIDGNEATGALALNLSGERPLVDGTLAFGALDLTPYVDAARSQSFVFDRPTASWSAFDLSFPIIRAFDADVRLSAATVALKGWTPGRGAAASVTVRAGKLLANIAEIELNNGTASAQISADTSALIPHYALRGKIENFDAGPAATALLGAATLTGRATLSMDLDGRGQTPAEVLRSLSGKVGLALPENGRLPLDIKNLQAVAKSNSSGWGTFLKGQTAIEQLTVSANIHDGVLFAESVQARSGAHDIAASGNLDLVDQTLNVRLAVKPGTRTDRTEKVPDMTGAAAVTLRGAWHQPTVRSEEPASPK
jgi:AsmA protein